MTLALGRVWGALLAPLALSLPLGCSTQSDSTAADGGAQAGAGTTPCPSAAPSDGTPCAIEGMRCSYGEALVDYLCTRSLTWTQRRYVVAAAAGGADAAAGAAGEAGASDGATPSIVDCSQFAGTDNCPKVCRLGCALGTAPNEGCAPICIQLPCEALAPEQCLANAVCEVRTDCTGKRVCAAHAITLDACGTVGNYADNVACCAGLTLLCGGPDADGSCAPGAGAAGTLLTGLPECLACGDGTCEAPLENRCNCPSDCAQ